MNRFTRISPNYCAGSGTAPNDGGGWFLGPNYPNAALYCEFTQPAEVVAGTVTISIIYRLSGGATLPYQFNLFATPYRLGVSRPTTISTSVSSSVFTGNVFLRVTATYNTVDFFPAGTVGTQMQIVPFTPPASSAPDMTLVSVQLEYTDER